MNLKRRHLELLRKRYRLPISLLMHETPPGSPLREKGFDIHAQAKVTGLLTCSEDVEELINICAVRGIEKLCIRYADYISMWSVGEVKEQIRTICNGGAKSATMKVVVLNPSVSKEKARLRDKLDALCKKLLDAAHYANTPHQRQGLEGLRFDFGVALEKSHNHAKSAEMMKNNHLEWLLLLELACDAPYSAQKEGLWLLKHFFPAEHAQIQLDGKIDAVQLELVCKRFQERVTDHEDIPSSFNLHQARKNLLGAFGRYHLEHKLVVALEKVCTAMDGYLKAEITEVKLSNIINSQIDVLRNMLCKRSLIGCQFIDLGEETENDTENDENEETSEDSGHEGSFQDDSEYKDYKFAEYEDNANMLFQGQYNDDEDEEDWMSDGSECSVNSPVTVEPVAKEETPISASSFVSTYSEIGDADFSLLLNLEYDQPGDKTSMNEIADKNNTYSENLGKAEVPSLDLNVFTQGRLRREHQHNASGGDSSPGVA